MDTQASLSTDLIKICICCRKVKDSQGEWRPIISRDATHLQETCHTICPQCSSERFPQFYAVKRSLTKRLLDIGKSLLQPVAVEK